MGRPRMVTPSVVPVRMISSTCVRTQSAVLGTYSPVKAIFGTYSPVKANTDQRARFADIPRREPKTHVCVCRGGARASHVRGGAAHRRKGGDGHDRPPAGPGGARNPRNRCPPADFLRRGPRGRAPGGARMGTHGRLGAGGGPARGG